MLLPLQYLNVEDIKGELVLTSNPGSVHNLIRIWILQFISFVTDPDPGLPHNSHNYYLGVGGVPVYIWNRGGQGLWLQQTALTSQVSSLTKQSCGIPSKRCGSETRNVSQSGS